MNRYNKVPNLILDTIWEKHKITSHTREPRGPAGDHKAAMKKRQFNKDKRKIQKRSTKNAPRWNGE